MSASDDAVRSGLARSSSHAGEAFQRVGGLTEIPELLRTLGCEPDDVICLAGVEPRALAHIENRIPYAAATRLLQQCTLRTGCAHFPLLAGQRWTVSHLGALGAFMKSAGTVGDALRRLADHQHRNSSAAAAFLFEYGETVSLGYAVYARNVVHLVHAYDVAMAFAVNILRELCGPNWEASEVLFARSAPQDVHAYRQHFRAPLRFDRDRNEVRFPARWLDQPLPETGDALPPAGSGAFDQMAEGDLQHSLHRALRVLLLSGRNSGDDVARTLAIHRRTLNRRLKAQGTTFQAILDEVRFEVARQLLEHTEAPIAEISAALCYAEVSAFTHAFRRWAGTTPHRWRIVVRGG